jgi:hypothetical protein
VLNIITKYESGEPFVDSKKGGRKKISTDSFELYFLKEELSRQIYRYHEKRGPLYCKRFTLLC